MINKCISAKFYCFIYRKLQHQDMCISAKFNCFIFRKLQHQDMGEEEGEWKRKHPCKISIQTCNHYQHNVVNWQFMADGQNSTYKCGITAYSPAMNSGASQIANDG